MGYANRLFDLTDRVVLIIASRDFESRAKAAKAAKAAKEIAETTGKVDTLIGPIRPSPEILPYAAKAALKAMTEAFAAAYGPAVRVNTLMSGPLHTAVSKHLTQSAPNVS